MRPAKKSQAFFKKMLKKFYLTKKGYGKLSGGHKKIFKAPRLCKVLLRTY